MGKKVKLFNQLAELKNRLVFLTLSASLLLGGCATFKESKEEKQNTEIAIEEVHRSSMVGYHGASSLISSMKEVLPDSELDLEDLEKTFDLDEKASKLVKKLDDMSEKIASFESIDLSGYQGNSIVDALNEYGYPSDFSFRKALADYFGIEHYENNQENGSKNLELLNLLRKTKHVKPESDSMKEIISSNQDLLSEAESNELLDSNLDQSIEEKNDSVLQQPDISQGVTGGIGGRPSGGSSSNSGSNSGSHGGSNSGSSGNGSSGSGNGNQGSSKPEQHTHHFSDWTVLNATQEMRVCSCGKKEVRDCKFGEEEIIYENLKNGSHLVINQSKCNTCTNVFSESYIENCDYSNLEKNDLIYEYWLCDCKDLQKVAHDFTKVIENADGTKTYYCGNVGCDFQKVEGIEHQHTFEDLIQSDKDGEIWKCTHIGCNEIENRAHNLDSGIENADGTKTYSCQNTGCNYQEIQEKEHQHTFEDLIQSDKDGEIWKCTHIGCNEIEHRAHNLDSGIENADGTKTYSCQNTGCNYSKVEGTIHACQFDELVSYDKKEEILKCGVCGKTTTRAHAMDQGVLNLDGTITKTCQNPNCGYSYTECPHNYNEDTKIVGTEAVCTSITRTCTICNDIEVIDNVNHQYREVYNDGIMTIMGCRVCGHEYELEEIREALPSLENNTMLDDKQEQDFVKETLESGIFEEEKESLEESIPETLPSVLESQTNSEEMLESKNTLENGNSLKQNQNLIELETLLSILESPTNPEEILESKNTLENEKSLKQDQKMNEFSEKLEQSLESGEHKIISFQQKYEEKVGKSLPVPKNKMEKEVIAVKSAPSSTYYFDFPNVVVYLPEMNPYSSYLMDQLEQSEEKGISRVRVKKG